MGIWKMIKTRNDVVALQRLMEAPIPAWRASDLLYNILGDDSLHDHFIAACRIDKGADVRSLIVNRIDQLYLTETPIEDICEIDAAEILKSCVDKFRPGDDDIFFKLQIVNNDSEACQPVMWVRDDSESDPADYTVKKDGVGLDYVVIAPDNTVYRVEGIDACVVLFHPDNAVRYHVGSMSSLTMN